jgi:hypothetical protein
MLREYLPWIAGGAVVGLFLIAIIKTFDDKDK